MGLLRSMPMASSLLAVKGGAESLRTGTSAAPREQALKGSEHCVGPAGSATSGSLPKGAVYLRLIASKTAAAVLKDMARFRVYHIGSHT